MLYKGNYICAQHWWHIISTCLTALGFWKWEISAENNLGRKMITCCVSSICSPSSFKPCLIFWQYWMKFFVLSVSDSQETDCRVFYFNITELLENCQCHKHCGIEVNCCSYLGSERVPFLYLLLSSCVRLKKQPSFQE